MCVLCSPREKRTRSGFPRDARRQRDATRDEGKWRRDVPVTRTMVSLPERSVTCCDRVRGDGSTASVGISV